MAEVTVTQYIDDLDGTELGEEAEHIAFSFDGNDYMIDLSTDNAAAFRDAMAPYVEAARRMGSTRSRSGRTWTRKPASQSSGVDTKAVREWARNNGWDISERGRIPANVMAAYNDAN